MAKAESISIKYMALSSLTSAKRNPKRHNLAAIGDAIDRHGYVRPVMINEKTGRLVAGHGRVEALTRLKEGGGKPPARINVGKDGDWAVPVIRGISFKTEKEAEAYLLADNRVGEIAGYNEAELYNILASQDSLEGTGFNEAYFDDLTYKLEDSHEEDESVEPFEFDGQLKQLICLFKTEDFDSVASRMEDIAEAVGLETNTDVLLHLLETYPAS